MQQAKERPKVLCIDDTPDVRLLVRRLLSSRYDVLEAEEGLHAIEVAREARPDLILVDLHMPHLDGYEVTTRLKSLMSDVPIVALTADVTAHVRERALAAGCDGYLSKPIDPDKFIEQVDTYLSGKREELEDDSFRRAYQEKLVARLEEQVQENVQLLEKARRQARLLRVGAEVGRILTSILELDTLLSTTVDVLCDEFDFYYAGVFLVDKTLSDQSGEWAVLRAGRGEPGEAMLAEGHKLKVGGESMIGAATGRLEARIALDVGAEPVHFKNPHLPHTRSEMALPLVVGGEVIGALTVQSTEAAAFDDDDITSLQSMADQLAVAINNARLLKDLEAAHEELMRTRTFRAIAATTGEAIHWVGNKAAPIPGSVARITEDLTSYLVMADALLKKASPALCEHPFAQMLRWAADDISAQGTDLENIEENLEAWSLERLREILTVESILEDLEIIENSAQAILNIKEDLIGPARQSRIETVLLPDLLEDVVASMGIEDEFVQTLFAPDLSPVRADKIQLDRVFTNLVKNAWEAMKGVEEKKLFIWAHEADDPDSVVVDVIDNGVGISDEEIDKIWMPFYTTKGDRGGTGLGLPACAQVIEQLGGKILVESDVGLGTTFSVYLPAATKS